MKNLLEKATQIVEEKMLENPTIPEELKKELIQEEYKKLKREDRWNRMLNQNITIEPDEHISPPGWYLESNSLNCSHNDDE